jgi:16S rRNA (guanine527-N7)-methyltransferase
MNKQNGSDLRAGVSRLGLDLAVETLEKLELFLNELSRWNLVHNLTAIEEKEDAIDLHLIDSIAIYPKILALLANRPEAMSAPKILDLGSGGGLPAIPLAIIRPDWSFLLVEASRKKAAFLQHIRGKLHLQNIEILAVRAETVALQRPSEFDFVTARAFSKLKNLLDFARPFLKPAGLVLAMKSKRAPEEIAEIDSGLWRLNGDLAIDVPGRALERRLLIYGPMRKLDI